MITDQEIQEKAREFGISRVDVEKDYVHGWVLNGVFTQSVLGNQLVLKGGNGLRKAYLANTRFSKDLDFSCEHSVDPASLVDELNRICAFVEHHAEVHFSPDKTVVKKKDVEIGINAVEARLYFKGFYGEESLTLKAQLDITQFDKIDLPIQARPLLHPYSDNDSCAAIVRCQRIEEILASKLTTLLHRRKAIDLFDLLYSIIFTHEFPVERLLVVSTFLKKSIFGPQPALAKNELLAVPLDEFRPLWSSVVAPVRSLFTFDYVLSNFRSLIEMLFGMLTPAASATAGRTGPMGRGFARSSQRFQSPSYFSSGVRNAILTGSRSQTLVELIYDDGIRRVVEPYRIEYYVRKKDGVGLEYFWGYDRTGGKSGPGIKRFICDKIASVTPTAMPFVAREF